MVREITMFYEKEAEMGSSQFYISEVVFGPDGYVTVTNGSDDPADPAGMQLCQFPAYPDLPSGEIPGGGSVQVPGSDLGGLEGASGEAALYLSPEYENPDAIAGYVQWGSADHKRSDPAIDAGLWEAGSFVEADGSARMETSGPGAMSATGWTVS